jgi:hypothetical protein
MGESLILRPAAQLWIVLGAQSVKLAPAGSEEKQIGVARLKTTERSFFEKGKANEESDSDWGKQI